MFESHAVPYFPLKLLSEGDGWVFHNPLSDEVHELNSSATGLLQLCDGFRTFGEITSELSRTFQTSRDEVCRLSEAVLADLTSEGVVWWRQQRMKCYRMPPPTTVLLDLTNKCNMRCRHCIVSAGKAAKDELSLGELRKLVDELAAFGVRELVLTGGEPMLHPHFFDIFEQAVSRGLSLQIATNGSVMTNQSARRLAAASRVQISLDGATPEVHDEFRRFRGAWQKAVRAIRMLVSAGVPVTMASVVTKANFEQISELYELAARLRADSFRIMPFIPSGRGSKAKELEVSPAEMHRLTADLHARREETGLPISPMEFECTLAPPPPAGANPQTRIGCDGAVAYCSVNCRGEVLPCNFFAGVDAENIRTHNFAWIWENSRFLNYFRSLTVSDIKGPCQDCQWLAACRGSCLAGNFARREMFQSNCRCWQKGRKAERLHAVT